MNTVLADLGGTHLRLCEGSRIEKFRIADSSNIESLLENFSPGIDVLYLASAVPPVNGVIEDRRFEPKNAWTISLDNLKKKFDLKKLVVLNDLEAAAYGLKNLNENDFKILKPATRPQIHFEDPPKVLIGIGTGIGHAFLFEKSGQRPFVQRTHGGHVPAIGLSKEQKDLVQSLPGNVIVESIVSGHGFASMQEILTEKESVRLFWEFLGLYCHYIVGLAGSYGGIYLTGGLMDQLVSRNQIDMDSFSRYFHQPMVPVVVETLAAVPIYYCYDVNLPITGLRVLSQ